MERDLALLPAPVWPILGRQVELDLAVSLLSDNGVRLLTLTGPAGVGKTRLALEAGDRSRDAFDMVAFVPLATLHDGAMLSREIASAVGISDATEPIPGLRALFGRQRVLLVLDNLEQMPDAGLALSPLLQALRGLTILATSRVRFSIAGEHVLAVEPLVVPGPDQTNSGLLSSNPAVQLLLLSARAANAAYQLPDDEWATVASIARRLDGLPLALQLAGARISVFGPRQVLGRLDRVLPILTDGPRDRPPRLQSMRDAIAWSYDLLAPDEQAFFRRLCVFDDGFTLEMAEAMARGWESSEGYPYLFGIPMPLPYVVVGREGPDSEQGEWAPVELTPLALPGIAGLESLIDKQLVRPGRTSLGVDRFQLLQSVREFGLEQLELEGELDAAEHARAVLMMTVAEASGLAMSGTSLRPAIAWMEAELPNLRASVNWLTTQPSAGIQIGLRMIEALWFFWQTRGHVVEGSALLEALLERPGGRPAMRAQALNLLAALCWFRSDLTRARAALDESLSLLEQFNVIPGQGRNFMLRSLIAWSERDYDLMEKMAFISKDRFARGDDVIGAPLSSLLLGMSARIRGDRARARALFDESYRAWNSNWSGAFPWGMAIAQYFLGEMAREDGDRVTAVSTVRDALEVFVSLEDPWAIGGCVGTLAIYLIEDGEMEEAARLLGAAEALESSHGLFLPPTETATHEAAARDVRQRIGPDAFAACFAEGQSWTLEEAAAHARRVPMESAAGRAARLARPALPEQEIPVLSERHLRTLQLRAAGRSIKEIALDEGVAPTSIYERFDRIREKLGLDLNASHADILMRAVRLGIL